MKKSFADIPIVLGHSEKHIYIELYEALRDAIVNGTIQDGEVIPSTRDLAQKLGVSRHTVLKSVKLLVTQGFLDTREQALSVVCPSKFEAPAKELHCTTGTVQSNVELKEELLSSSMRAIMQERDTLRFPQMNFAPEPDDLEPFTNWDRILNNIVRCSDKLYSDNVDESGATMLKIAVSKYLNRFRSLRSNPDNVVIFSGPTAALDFLARMFVDPNDSVLMENPGFKHARNLFTTYGAQIDAVNVDRDGLCVPMLASCTKKAKLLYVTPAHQNPTGATMSLSRRKELLAWSQATCTPIIEDGYDSEYWHMKDRPLPAIQGLDESGSVIYLASFWRILFPVTKLSFAVFPDKCMPVVKKLKGLLGCDASLIEQRVLAEFLEQGLFERALRKNQRVLSSRRIALVVSLTKHLGSNISIAKESSGTNLLVRFNINCEDEKIEQAAYHANLPLVSTGSYYVKDPVPSQFLLPFTNLKEERIDDVVKQFTNQLKAQIEQSVNSESFMVRLPQPVDSRVALF